MEKNIEETKKTNNTKKVTEETKKAETKNNTKSVKKVENTKTKDSTKNEAKASSKKVEIKNSPKKTETKTVSKKEDVKVNVEEVQVNKEEKVESTKDNNSKKINLNEIKNKITSINFKDKRTIGIIIASLIFVIILIYFLCFNYKKYKIEDVFEFNIEGFSGYASITYNIKEEYVGEDIETLINNSEIYVSNEENIKNGDVITFSIRMNESVSKNLKVKIDDVYEITVSGLEEPKVLDLFKDLNIGYTDKSPYLKLSFRNDDLDTKKYNINYTVESLDNDKEKYYIKKGWFYNGEKIKVKATYDKELLAQDGYVVVEDFIKTEVSKQDEYFTSKEQITTEMKDTIAKKMLEDVKAYAKPETMKRIYCNNFYCSATAGGSNRVEDYNLESDPKLLNMYLGIKENVQQSLTYEDFTHTAIIGSFRLSFVGDDNNRVSGGKHYMYCNVHYDNIYLTHDGKMSDYTTEENFVRCSTSASDESDIKNRDVTGKYQYSEVIKLD